MNIARKELTLAALAALTLPAAGQHLGSWDFWEDNVGEVEATMLRAVHAMLLPDGTILAFNREIGRFTGAPRRYEVLEAFRAVRLVPTRSGNPWWERDYTSFDIFRSYRQSADVFERELFCAGHVLQANGHAHIIGGHTKVIERQGDDDVLVRDNVGQPYVMVFKPHDGSYSFFMRPNTARGRGYPTPVVLPNSDVLTFAGSYFRGETEERNSAPTLHTHDLPTGLDSFRHDFPLNGDVTYAMHTYYPFVFVDPTIPSTDPESGGRLYYASRRYANFTHADLEINLATLESNERNRQATKIANDYPSAAMLDDVIVLSGGAMSESADAEKRVFTIDLASSSRAWVARPDMTRARKNHTLAVLPTGHVVAMGGHWRGNANHDEGGVIDALTPEVWRPGQSAWTALTPPPLGDRRRRGYHSTTMLLPDGRVWLAGGDPPPFPNDELEGPRQAQRTVNVFSPPYGGFPDWPQRRPLIEAHPAEMHYGRDYPMSVRLHGPDRDLRHVVLIALPSATHAFDVGARLRTLTLSNLSREGNVVSFRVNAPSDPSKATPGYYMLFAVDKLGSGEAPLLDGVPSRAKIIRLRDYDRADVLQEAGIALDGQSGFTLNPSPTDLLLRDNRRLGLSINTGLLPTGSQLILTGLAPTEFARDFRFQMEWHATSDCEFTVEAYNFATSAWEVIRPTQVENFPDNKDRFFHVAVLDHLIGVPHKFIDPLTKIVRARLTWLDSDPVKAPFSVNIDYVRWGIRP